MKYKRADVSAAIARATSSGEVTGTSFTCVNVIPMQPPMPVSASVSAATVPHR